MCEFRGQSFVFVDSSGQKDNRDSWPGTVNSAACVMYFAAASDFDVTIGDERENRMRESVAAFRTVVNAPEAASKPVILCLNKLD